MYVNGIPRYHSLIEDEIAADVVNSWKDSTPQRANMLEEIYGQAGIGIKVDSNGNLYATENFC